MDKAAFYSGRTRNLRSGQAGVRASAVGLAAMLWVCPHAGAETLILLGSQTAHVIDSVNPGTILYRFSLRPPINESAMAITERPATGELYCVTFINGAYSIGKIDVATGQVTRVGVPFYQNNEGGAAKAAGADFNPVTDQFRVVVGRDQNFVLNPETAAIVSQESFPTGTGITATAFAPSGPRALGALGPTCYLIDAASSTL